MNKRGSVLVNVLIITGVLMILGLIGLRVVAADMLSAQTSKHRAVALQMAEGGLDYGLELILKSDQSDLVGTHQVTDDLAIDITYQDNNCYLISSTATEGNTQRTVHLVVQHTPVFGHSLYVGDTEQPLALKNVTFEGPVQIFSPIFDVDNNVVFNGGVHFENEDVVVNGEYTVGNGHIATFGDSGSPVPDIQIELLEGFRNNFKTDPINDIGSVEVNFNDLTTYNYYSGDVEITWSGQVTGPADSEGIIVIVSTGSVGFTGKNNIDDAADKLVVIAGGDIYGEFTQEDMVDNIQIPLYLYAKGSISIHNNMKNIRSVIALDEFHLGPSQDTWEFHQFDVVEVPGLEDAWGSLITINQWSN